ncbi:MAG: ABC transporter ATP-binding protein, partial [Planctomycetota bacterium]
AFSYRSRPVLRDVTFQVAEGELLAILGPNGVGKTTALKCINAILRPRAGAILLEDMDVLHARLGEIARAMSYVAQRVEPARLTAFDAVLMGRKPHLRGRASERDLTIVDAALRRLHLSDLALRYIDEMSGGELQKVAIARALVQEPRLLLLDEPTSSLDLKNQLEILSLVRRVVAEHHVAAIMTMHDLNTAFRFAHKFLLLKDGAVYAAGPVGEIRADLIEAVYGVPVELREHRGRPLVIPDATR